VQEGRVARGCAVLTASAAHISPPVSGLNPSTTVSSLSSGSSALDTLHVVDSRYTHFHKNVAWITAGNASGHAPQAFAREGRVRGN